jgi:hypothetical protein
MKSMNHLYVVMKKCSLFVISIANFFFNPHAGGSGTTYAAPLVEKHFCLWHNNCGCDNLDSLKIS